MTPGRHRVPAAHQRFAATYVLPAAVARRLHHRLPDPAAALPVLHGLRQWLRLRILTEEPMGMPSLAVQAALKDFLSCREDSAAFFRGAFGRHRPPTWSLDGFPPGEADAEAMALTWAMACNDQHKRPTAPGTLPWLFSADDGLPAGLGWGWRMQCREEPCQAPGHCVHHDLLPCLPESIPHQIRFDLPASYPLADKSDSPWVPGNYVGWI